jgi:hypothetical protein
VRNALLGFLLWLVGLVLVWPEWAEALLLLGALGVVPLGLALVEGVEDWGRRIGLNALLPWFQIAAAIVLLVSFLRPAGPRAGLLAFPWLAFTAVAALFGMLRLRTHGFRSMPELAVSAGLIFLAVGGGWTFLSRWGARPLGFGEPIVLLTGAHFHYAGFALPLLTGLAAARRSGLLARLAIAGVVLGVPAVAAGIATTHLTHTVELASAWLLALACVLVAVLQLRAAQNLPLTICKVLLSVSSLSLLAGMALAAIYALGMYHESAWLTIPTMIHWHATINALGFALLGLLAWQIERLRAGATEAATPLPSHP